MMRQLFLKLFLASGLSLFLGVSAHATVSCSVPFILTNGTIADATQVMANYNAILACLSTNAASAGSNSDITSLNGLTTPITPAQGGAIGLCGATGFTAKNNAGTPNTQIDITFSQAVVVTPANKVLQYGVNGAVTLNLGTAGAANGLDTGALAASTIYNIWLIGNGTLINSLGSLSATAPSLPAGYTGLCRVAAWETNTLSQLLPMSSRGNKTMLLQKSGGSGSNITAGALQFTTISTGTCSTFATDTLVLTAFSGIPPTATEAIGVVSAGGGGAFVSQFGPTVRIEAEIGGAPASAQFDLNLPTAQSIWLCTGTGVPAISVMGWVDAVNAH
jgi:hypothetical protein